MIQNDHEVKVTRGRISHFLDLLARFWPGSRAEELALVSGGWREELARIRRSDSGCGCAFIGLVFAFFALFFLAGCGFLGLMGGSLLLEWRANNRYLSNSCVVLDGRLAIGTSDHVVEVADGVPRTEPRPSYRPEIKIQYEVGGRKYEVWTKGSIGGLSSDRAAQQAIVDSFRVGATYPCWYDPDRPDRAILVRGYAWYAHVALIVPIVFLVFGGAGMLLLWKNRGKTAHQLWFERAPRAGQRPDSR
jgi:hypothetical protein